MCHGFAQGVLGLPWFAGMGDPSGEEFPREAGVRHLGKFANPTELAAGDDIGTYTTVRVCKGTPNAQNSVRSASAHPSAKDESRTLGSVSLALFRTAPSRDFSRGGWRTRSTLHTVNTENEQLDSLLCQTTQCFIFIWMSVQQFISPIII